MQEPPTQPARERQHCFIVRLDGRLDDLIQAHRRRLERKRRGKVPLAEAARDLFAQALGVKSQRTLRRDPRQLGLPGLRGPAGGKDATDPRLTHSEAACAEQSVNCEHCGDPIPPGSRPSRRF